MIGPRSVRSISGRQAGISLLEVILALAILAGGMTVLARLVEIGTRGARDAQLVTQAQLLCESHVAQMQVGLVPVQSTQPMEIDGHPDWLVSTQVQPAPVQGLAKLTVQVHHVRYRHWSGYTLVRWIRDPSLPLPEESLPAPYGAETSGQDVSGSEGAGT